MKFDFTMPACRTNFSGCSEIDLYGMPTQVAATNPTATDKMTLPTNPASGSVFYRMIDPECISHQ